MSLTPHNATIASVNKFFGAADARLSNAAATGAARLGTVASKGGLIGKAAGWVGKGLMALSNLHPAAKAVAIAGTALVATKALTGSSHPAAERVA